MKARHLAWLLQWLIAVDQLAAVWLCWFTYVLLGRGECPNADETISSIVGRHALAGARWAFVVERAIDWLFEAIGTGAGHCRRSIEWDEVEQAPASDKA